MKPWRRIRRGIVGRLAVAPSVVALFLWMIVPLGMTIWFSLLRYNLLDPGNEIASPGSMNYRYFLTDPGLLPGAWATR